MKRQYLSIEEHGEVAKEICGILDAHSRILNLISGLVPAKIIDQLCTAQGVDRTTNRLRSDLENELNKRHPGALSVYYRCGEKVVN